MKLFSTDSFSLKLYWFSYVVLQEHTYKHLLVYIDHVLHLV